MQVSWPSKIDKLKLCDIQRKAKYQVSAWIRNNARRVMRRASADFSCSVCGYSNHVEVCHIRPIADFPPDALVEQVNDLKNLLALCPNHHWELDNGILEWRPRQDSNLRPVS